MYRHRVKPARTRRRIFENRGSPTVTAARTAAIVRLAQAAVYELSDSEID